MKIFDFKCVKCGHVEERIVKSDTQNPDCNKCGHYTERLVSAPGMVKTPGSGGRTTTR